jgi:hypothetical protein
LSWPSPVHGGGRNDSRPLYSVLSPPGLAQRQPRPSNGGSPLLHLPVSGRSWPGVPPQSAINPGSFTIALLPAARCSPTRNEDSLLASFVLSLSPASLRRPQLQLPLLLTSYSTLTSPYLLVHFQRQRLGQFFLPSLALVLPVRSFFFFLDCPQRLFLTTCSPQFLGRSIVSSASSLELHSCVASLAFVFPPLGFP